MVDIFESIACVKVRSWQMFHVSQDSRPGQDTAPRVRLRVGVSQELPESSLALVPKEQIEQEGLTGSTPQATYR
jgi:hypothetical protein